MKPKEKKGSSIYSLHRRLNQLLDYSPSKISIIVLKNYTAYFEAERKISKIIKSLKFFEKDEYIPLETLESLAEQIDLVIAELGEITYYIKLRIDETRILAEINQTLGLKEPWQVEFISHHIHILIAAITSSYKDRNFNKCLDFLKEKSWLLLEAMDEYSVKQYKKSIF